MTTKKNKEVKEDEAIQIVLRPSEIKVLSWRNIEPFQPNGFKVGNTDGIWKSIANNDLLDKFKVFQIPGSKKYFMFDGHTRKKLMLEKEEDGIAKFPDTMECQVFQFKTKQEAAKSLLEYQAGKLKISEIGLIEFAESVQVDTEEMMFIVEDTGLDMILDSGLSQDELNQFFTEDDGSVNDNKKQKIVLEYTYEDFEKVNAAFEKIGGSKEQIVFKLLGCK